jgi:copper chaperone CopZ
MKKGFAILALFIVAVVITYNAFDWRNIVDNTSKAMVSLVNGTTIELNAEEAALPVAPQERKVVISDLGMVCAGCKATVVALMKEIKGVSTFYVNLEADRVTIVYDINAVSLDQIKQRIVEKGGKIGDVKEINS